TQLQPGDGKLCSTAARYERGGRSEGNRRSRDATNGRTGAHERPTAWHGATLSSTREHSSQVQRAELTHHRRHLVFYPVASVELDSGGREHVLCWIESGRCRAVPAGNSLATHDDCFASEAYIDRLVVASHYDCVGWISGIRCDGADTGI